ncbi:hypothetical protein Tco_1285025 [Tanacetum coccineum]
MPPRMRTQSAGRPAAESLGGGTGELVSRGGRGRRPREGNDERVDELNGQGNGLGESIGVTLLMITCGLQPVSYLYDLQTSELAIYNLDPTDGRSTLSIVKCLKRCSLDAGMVICHTPT